MKRIAISGASGLVGAELSRQLVAAGHTMIHLRRPSSSGIPNPDCKTLEWIPQTGIVNFHASKPLDAVVHLAGRNVATRRWSKAEKQRLWDSRVVATGVLARQLADAKSPPAVFISASAIGIYGDCDQRILSETSPTDSNNFLGRLAIAWEHACQPLSDGPTRVIHPRFGIILDKHAGALAKMLPLFRYGLGGRLGSGNQKWSWISLYDSVAAIRWMLNTPGTTGVYNVVAPNAVSNKQFTHLLAAALNRPKLLPAPAWLLRLATGEMANALLLSSCHARPTRLLAADFKFRHTTVKSLFESTCT